MFSPIVISRNKKYGNNYWTSNGPKVGRKVGLYSDLEFDHFVRVDTNPNVITYCEQPLEISYVCNEKIHTSIFDMWIKYQDGEEVFVEIKYSIELKPHHHRYSRTMRQIGAQQKWCEENGYKHIVMTEASIRESRIERENRIKMLSIVSNMQKPDNTEKILCAIKMGRCTIQELLRKLDSEFTINKMINICAWLMYTGVVCTNITETLWGHSTEVWIDDEE
ncbi:TnsA endonuclease N-terminal domain-containing protein [Paenibacillus agilis]|nr:TnsA endonuclease N-terminal domain-containing protein [Paenibacillus agilis]